MTAELGGRAPALRLPVDLPVEVTAPGGSPQAGRVVNLTRTGLFIATPTPAPAGTVVGLTLTLLLPGGERRVAATAAVRWVNEAAAPRAATVPPGMGLEFVALDPAAREALEAVRAERLAALARGVSYPVAASRRPVPPRA
jgi:uncharacterized protein (TIGR02266 family)